MLESKLARDVHWPAPSNFLTCLLPFFRDAIDPDLACSLALSNVDFYTGEHVGDFTPENFKVRSGMLVLI